MPILITAKNEPGRVVHITHSSTTDQHFSTTELQQRLARELALANTVAKRAGFGRLIHRADAHDAITLTYTNGAQIRVTAP
jgi:hypothetical protein